MDEEVRRRLDPLAFWERHGPAAAGRDADPNLQLVHEPGQLQPERPSKPLHRGQPWRSTPDASGAERPMACRAGAGRGAERNDPPPAKCPSAGGAAGVAARFAHAVRGAGPAGDAVRRLRAPAASVRAGRAAGRRAGGLAGVVASGRIPHLVVGETHQGALLEAEHSPVSVFSSASDRGFVSTADFFMVVFSTGRETVARPALPEPLSELQG